MSSNIMDNPERKLDSRPPEIVHGQDYATALHDERIRLINQHEGLYIDKDTAEKISALAMHNVSLQTSQQNPNQQVQMH